MSQGNPQECMGTIARVRLVMTREACSRSKQAVRGLISTKIGTYPNRRMGTMVAKNVYEGVRISAPGGRSSAKKPDVNALVPLIWALTKGALVYPCHSFSKTGSSS